MPFAARSLTQELRRAYTATTFTARVPGGEVRLRVGKRHPDLDALLDEHRASTWAYVTAHNPGSVSLEPSVNARAHARLKREVVKRGLDAYEGMGVPDDRTWTAERSILILGIPEEEAIALGARFRQLTIVVGVRGRAARLVAVSGRTRTERSVKPGPSQTPGSNPEQRHAAAIRQLFKKWGIAPGALQVTVSPLLTRTLARCWPRTGRIEISARAVRRPAMLNELLCHEAAHLAVHVLHGPGCRPHGPEWQALMRQAGFEPRATLAAACRVMRPRPSSSVAAARYEHVCVVCGTRRLARRPVPQWRCAACVAAGLDGKLTIRRQPAQGAGAR